MSSFENNTLAQLRERARLNSLRGIATSQALKDEIARRENENTPQWQRSLSHTPGPWAVTMPNKFRHYYVRRASAVVGELAVCQIMTGRHSEERDANARLIAAAPDLLAALEELTARCDGTEGVRADGSNIQTIQAHAALAKVGL